MLHDGAGWGCLAGITAVHMAGLGFKGAPAITVEAPAVAAYWQDLGRRWLLDEQYIKPYPICRWAHAPIDGVLRLRAEHDLSGGDIEAVEIVTFHEAVRLHAGLPASTSVAQYSLAFPVAAALVNGEVGIRQITGEALRDPAVAALLPRIKVREGDFYNERFPAGRWAEVTLQLKDGRTLTSGPLNARGGLEAPLSEMEILDKFRQYAGPVLGPDRTEAVKDAVLRLDAADSAFDDLLDLICRT